MNTFGYRWTLSLLLLALAGQSLWGQNQRHLFLDPSFVKQTENAALRVNPPQQRERVITHDQPWEQLMISFYLTVRDEEGKLRLWYICRDKDNKGNVAYAESTDGLHWLKPNLGIVDYHGSTSNNLVGLTSLEGTVFRDPNAPPDQKYAYVTHVAGKGIVRFYSPDGLHWQQSKKALITMGGDNQAVTFWDEQIKRYVLYLRGWDVPSKKEKFRKVIRTTLPDLVTPLSLKATATSLRMWGKDNGVFVDEFPTVFAADAQDPPNSDVYTISAQPYPLDSRWYVGFPSMFQREKGVSDGRLEVNFIGSRDGIKWQRYDRRPYLVPGLADSESANMVFIGVGMVMRGDEIWLYGTGLRSRHGDREARQRETDGVIYRYVQRVDGFVSLDFDAPAGKATTQPVTVEGPRLLLNVDTSALGHLCAGLLDADGKPIPGFALEDCDALRINSTHAVVSWKGQSDLSSLKDRQVQVAFAGARAKLFSFYFGAGDAARQPSP